MKERCVENAESQCKSYPNCYGCNSFRKPTNYDRIRNMSIEEMADYICHNYKCRKCDWEHNTCSSKCVEGIKRWLETEVAE